MQISAVLTRDRHKYRQLMLALSLRQGPPHQHGNRPGVGQIVIAEPPDVSHASASDGTPQALSPPSD
jgi:hypothetical protein